MAGTRIKKGIKDYKRIIDEGKTTKDKGKEYQDFLSSLETLLNSTEELYKRDQNGQYKKMEKKDYLSISKNYSALRESCSNFVNKENKNKFEKNHLEIAKRLQTYIKKDMEFLAGLDLENLPSLPEAVKEARTQKITLSGTKIKTVGGMQSKRIPLKMKGGGKGFFTEETKYDKKKVWLDLLNEMTEHFPDPYKGELKGMAANIDAVVKDETEIELERPNWIWVENKEGKKERKKELKKENVKIPVEIANFMGKVYEDDKLNADAKYKDSVDILMKGIRSVHIRKDVAERTGITEKSRLDQRNSAMYVTAKLLGRPELLAKAVPLTIVRDGKEIQGTFMEKAEGVDISRIKPGDLDLDYDQDTFNHPKALKQIADLQVIDFICGNTDRHKGNMIYQFGKDENGKVVLDQIKGIDNDSSFGFRFHYKTNQITSPEKMKVISEEMKNKLFSVDPKELKFALMPFGFSEKELGALEARYLIVQNEIRQGNIKVVKESEWKNWSLKTLSEKGNLFDVIQEVQPSLMEKKEARKAAETQQKTNTQQSEKTIEFAETGEGKSESVSEFQENHKKLMKLAKIMHKENHNLYINSGVFNEMKNKVYEMEKISTQLSNKYQNKGGVLETEDMNKLDRLYQELRKVSDSYIEAKKIAPESGHGQRRLALAKDLRDLAFDFCDFRNMEEMDAAKEEEIQISL